MTGALISVPDRVAVLGGGRVDLVKATRRGKLKSVDWMLRRSAARKLERRLGPVFSEWRRRIADQLRRAYARTVKAEDVIVDRILAELDARGFSVDVIEELTPALRRTFREAGISALQEIGFDATEAIVQHVDDGALFYASNHGADLVTRITETVRTDLREMIVNAIDRGLSAQAFADEIEGAFPFSDARSIMIARTELAFAHTQGNISGWRESGVVGRKKWIVAQDNVCDVCIDLDGQIVGLDDEFDGGEHGNVSAPPLHPNCRCDVVAVLADE